MIENALVTLMVESGATFERLGVVYPINNAAVVAITDRCYPVKVPQDPTYPFILYTKITGVRDHVLSGPSKHAHPRYQIDCRAKTFTQSKQLAEAVRILLDGFIGTVGGTFIGSCLSETERDIYEPKTLAYRTIIDFMIWHKEL